MLRWSFAFQRISSFAPLLAAERPEIVGGVLSMTNGSLASVLVKAWSGGLSGRSEAVIRRTYSPSGNAVESQLTCRSRSLSLSSFHSDSATPRISALNASVSPFSSEAAQRAPISPFAYCIDAEEDDAAGEGRAVFLLPPSGGSVIVCDGVTESDGAGKR